MRVALWTDRRGNFAVIEKGCVVFSATDVSPGFYSLIVDAKDVRYTKGFDWDKLLEDWKDELYNDGSIDDDGMLTKEILDTILQEEERISNG